MKTITFEFSEDQFDRLKRAAEDRDETVSDLLRAVLIDVLTDPTDPFDPRGRCQRARDEEFQRRIA
jgi:hypothetical protein